MLLGTVLVLLLLGGAGPASAHAALRSTDPGDGSVVRSAPRHVTLTFTESVGLLDDSFRVYDPDGRRIHTDEPQHADGSSQTARVSLPAKLGQGTYTVAWRVVSADSHPVSGALTFSVGKASATAPVAGPGPVEDPVTSGLYDVARYLAYLAAALLVGTAAFVTLCRPPEAAPLRKPLVAGWWSLLAATLALLLLRAPYETGTGPATALDPDSLGRTLTSRPGLALLARLALVLVVGALLVRLSRRRAGVVAVAEGTGERRDGDGPTPVVLASGTALAVGLALTWAAAEHASAGIQVPLAMASSVLHLLATGVWLGGLAALLISLHRAASPLPPATVTRFSRLAFASVTVLVVTGVYQSWRGLGSWSAFTGTSYGRLLIAKLAVVAALLLAAGWSRRWTARLATADAQTAVPERVPEPVGGPPLPPEPEREVGQGPDQPLPSAGPERYRRDLRRSVLAEVAVGAVVLLITTVLTGTLPGRAEAEAAQAAPAPGGLPAPSVVMIPFDVGTPGGRGKVQVTVEPGRVGENGVQAVVYAADGGLTSVPELRLSFTLPDKKIGPIDAGLTDQGGYWSTNTVTLPLPGTWTMKATVRVSEVDQVSESKPVRIDP